MSVGVKLPPPPVDNDDFEEGGSGSEWVRLIVARDDIDAHLLAGRLLEAGIESRILKDRSVPTWLFGGSNPWAPVTVFVRRFQLDDARLVVAEVNLREPFEDRPPDQRTAQRRVPFRWWAVAVVVAAAVMFTIFAQVLARTAGCQLAFFCEPAPTGERR